MPIYAYKCKRCQHEFDTLQKFSDEPLKQCPQCKKQGLEKQLSTNTGFCLMGTGWSRPGLSASKGKSG